MNNNMAPWGISKRAWQGNGSKKKLLCQLERRFHGNGFYRALLDCPAFEFKAGLGDKLVFVAADTAFPKNFRIHRILVGWVLEILANPFVRALATRAPLTLDADGKVRPIWMGAEVPDSGQTVVLDAQHQMVYAFEAGRRYIRLVTARDVKHQQFYAHKGAAVIKVWSDGLIGTKNIDEVCK